VRDHFLELRDIFQTKLSIILVQGKPALDEAVGLFLGGCVKVLRILFEEIKANIVDLSSLCDVSIVNRAKI
jgi:hypothetical protein